MDTQIDEQGAAHKPFKLQPSPYDDALARINAAPDERRRAEIRRYYELECARLRGDRDV